MNIFMKLVRCSCYEDYVKNKALWIHLIINITSDTLLFSKQEKMFATLQTLIKKTTYIFKWNRSPSSQSQMTSVSFCHLNAQPYKRKRNHWFFDSRFGREIPNYIYLEKKNKEISFSCSCLHEFIKCVDRRYEQMYVWTRNIIVFLLNH